MYTPINLYDVSISTVLSCHLSFGFLSLWRRWRMALSVFCILFHHKVLIYSHSAKGETGEPSKWILYLQVGFRKFCLKLIAVNFNLYWFSFLFSDFIFYLCSAFHFKPRRRTCRISVAGFFMPVPLILYGGFAPPCRMLVHLLLSWIVECNGTGGTASFIP